jgi:hypothetical protein
MLKNESVDQGGDRSTKTEKEKYWRIPNTGIFSNDSDMLDLNKNSRKS